MKTTLNIDDQVMQKVKETALREGRTITDIVESALRIALMEKLTPPKRLPKLPTFKGGGYLVDISDREALYEILDQDRKDVNVSGRHERLPSRRG